MTKQDIAAPAETFGTFAKRERERSMREAGIGDVATDQVGVSTSDRPSFAAIHASPACCSSSSYSTGMLHLASPAARARSALRPSGKTSCRSWGSQRVEIR